jgi:hypothetical protein
MPIPVTCFACGYQTKVSDRSAGKKGRCPKCGNIVDVPLQDEPAVVEAEVVDLDGLASGEPATIPLAAPPPPLPGSAATPGDDRRPCPVCGELIPRTALKCRYCNEIFDERLKKEAAKKQRGGDYADDLTVAEWVVAILCSGIGCICGIVWMIQGKPKGKKMFLISLISGLVWGAIRAGLAAAGAS